MRVEANKTGHRWVLNEKEAAIMDALRAEPTGMTHEELRERLSLSRMQMQHAMRPLVRYKLVRRIPPGSGVAIWQAYTPDGWPSKAAAMAKYQNVCRVRYKDAAFRLPHMRAQRKENGPA